MIDPLRDRTEQLIAGFADAALAAQSERTPEAIFRSARNHLAGLGLSVVFGEVHGELLTLFMGAGRLREIAASLEKRTGQPLRVTAAPFWHAIRRSQHGVLIERLRAMVADSVNIPVEEIDLEPEVVGVGATITVAGSVEFAVLAAGVEFDRAIAPAFGLFARQLGTALETARRLDELARSNRELTAVNHVARASADLGSERALDSALEWLAQSLSIRGIALFRREGAHLLLSAHVGMPRTWVERVRREGPREASPWSRAAAGDEPHAFTLQTMNDSVAFPLRAGEELQGVLIACGNSAPLAADEVRLLGTVSAQLAISLQNTILFQQSVRRVTELSLLLELGQTVAGTLDQREILDIGARVAARILRCSAAYIFVPDEQIGSLACAAREDALTLVPADVRLPLDTPSMSALAFRTGKAQSSHASSGDPRIDQELAAQFGCRSTLAVPLASHNKIRGVLVLFERSVERNFDAQDTRLAVHAAQLLAASLESAALYAEQQRRAEEMTLLNEAARSLAGSLELEPLLSDSAETLRRLVDASHALIYLLDPDKGELRVHTAPREFPELAGRTLSLAQPSAAASAVHERKAVQVRNAPTSTQVARDLAKLLEAQTVLAIPLLARGELIGAVVLSDKRRGRVFSNAEIERATAVAGQIAMAMIAARLIEDLRSSYSELERAQVERVDRERLAALGELSASIAHEVRNPLGVVFNALASLRRLLKQEGNVGLLLGIIAEEAERLNRMVGDLLDYSRPYQPALQPVPLAALVADALMSARTTLPGIDLKSGSDAGTRIEMRIPTDLTVRADPRLLRQALVNLFINAFQAMPKEGMLDVVAERVTGEGSGARVRIRDSGPGIPEQVRPRIFHPFFTTKATGTGLGLAVVKRILESHGGTISLREGEESGTEFELFLPVEE